MTQNPQDNRKVYTVSRLSQEAHALLEREFGMIWLEGEISNFSKPGSGHFYFSLKDSRAQIRCAMFRNKNRQIGFVPENGQQILLKGKLSIYQQRGDFQLIADHIELAGRGMLQQTFENTVARLREAGWFDEQHKRPLPAYPRTIGVITSPSGAAVQDILNVLSRRYPVAEVIIYPTLVQGADAAPAIAQAIEKAGKRARADVLILARGGGSLEDLWGFNEEIVANAIRCCAIPVICGVGHEIDFSIADLVADVRAPTPSAAAELAVPDIIEERARLRQLENLLYQALENRTRPAARLLEQLGRRLQAQHPQRVLAQRSNKVSELQRRLQHSMLSRQSQLHSALCSQRQQLLHNSPQRRIEQQTQKLATTRFRLQNRLRELVSLANSRLSQSSRALDTVSPLATLGRGYSVLRDEQQNIITSHKQVESGDKIVSMLHDGGLVCEVSDTFAAQNVRKPKL